VTSAENIRKMVEGSDLCTVNETKVQDAYSMRSSPQVIARRAMPLPMPARKWRSS